MNQRTNRPSARFPLGQIVATPGALDALREAQQEPLALPLCSLVHARHYVADGLKVRT